MSKYCFISSLSRFDFLLSYFVRYLCYLFTREKVVCWMDQGMWIESSFLFENTGCPTKHDDTWLCERMPQMFLNIKNDIKVVSQLWGHPVPWTCLVFVLAYMLVYLYAYTYVCVYAYMPVYLYTLPKGFIMTHKILFLTKSFVNLSALCQAF